MYILGVHLGHDCSAALLKDGKLVAAAEEERFNRVKHSAGIPFPFKAIDFCLNHSKIGIDEVELIALSNFPPWKYFIDVNIHHILTGFFLRKPVSQAIFLYKTLINAVRGEPKKQFRSSFGRVPQVKYFEHLICHAASAYYPSGFESSAILTMDDRGEVTSTLLSAGKRERLEVLERINWPNSLGTFYAGFTEYLGYVAGDGEGKIMGLASYGNPKLFEEKMNDVLRINPDGTYSLNTSYFHSGGKTPSQIPIKHYSTNFVMYSQKMVDVFGSPCPKISLLETEKRYQDIAAALQYKLEQAAVALTKRIIDKSGETNLALGGGVALNCVMNGRILRSGLVKNLFIQPCANDAGCSLGAALQAYAELGHKNDFVMDNAYWGPEFSNEEIKKILDECNLRYDYYDDISGETAKLLSEGKIVGWFQGRMEWGPRALGNRSILMSPLKAENKDIINLKVKHRENYRPLCPSLLAEAADEYLEDARPSPFMILSFYVKPEKRKEIPAVTHIDGTARPQTVEKTVNLRYYKLIKSFEDYTGIPVLLNTSMNIQGEPMVCKPKEAINCLYTTGMDALAIGNYLIKK